MTYGPFEDSDAYVIAELMSKHSMSVNDIAEKWGVSVKSAVQYMESKGLKTGLEGRSRINVDRCIIRVVKELGYSCSIRTISLATGFGELIIRDALSRHRVLIDDADAEHIKEMLKKAEYCRNLIVNKICSRREAIAHSKLTADEYKYWYPRLSRNKKAR